MKRLPLIAVVLVVLGIGWFYVKSKESPDPASSIATAEVMRKTIVETVEVAGDVKPEILVEVKPEISARILKIYVKESDIVKSGDPLIDLDNSELLTQKAAAETDIAIAELQLEKANRDLDRQEKLLKTNIITTQNYRDARTTRDVVQQDLRKTRQQLETIESRLGKTRVVAPLNGTVLSLPVVENQVVVGAASVSAGTLLLSVADLGSLVITSNVNQVDVAKLTVGLPLEFQVDSIGDIRMKGHVLTIAPMATIVNNIKGYVVNFKIDDPDPRLRPGMTAQVTIPTSKVEDVPALPVAAIFDNRDGEKVVYLSGGTGAPQEKPVEIGLANTSFAEIKGGVATGARVLLSKPAPKS